MKQQWVTCAALVLCLGLSTEMNAQANKEKKSKYYQNNEPQSEFDVQGFATNKEKKEVESAPKEDEYDVKISRNEADSKYMDEKRVMREDDEQQPPVTKTKETRKVKVRKQKEVEIKMTEDEHEYKTTVVKRRYTNLDVLCDDLDLAKIQRPVFKGICQECASDVDAIITNKNWSSLEKNYQLKQCYMMRDKRLRETLDEDQYRKFLRIKDADEYLVLTHDPELKDGVNN
jgi:lipopolysaccharide export LptBFGC system permease protein LptF